MSTINLPQWKRTLPLSDKTTIMEQLLASGIPVASSCKGDGICGKCKLQFSNSARPLPEPSLLEIQTLEKADGQTDERLSCQVKVSGAVTLRADYW